MVTEQNTDLKISICFFDTTTHLWRNFQKELLKNVPAGMGCCLLTCPRTSENFYCYPNKENKFLKKKKIRKKHFLFFQCFAGIQKNIKLILISNFFLAIALCSKGIYVFANFQKTIFIFKVIK